MAGRPVAYNRSLSRNVIRIFDLDVMTAGVVDPAADLAAKRKALEAWAEQVKRLLDLADLVAAVRS